MSTTFTSIWARVDLLHFWEISREHQTNILGLLLPSLPLELPTSPVRLFGFDSQLTVETTPPQSRLPGDYPVTPLDLISFPAISSLSASSASWNQYQSGPQLVQFPARNNVVQEVVVILDPTRLGQVSRLKAPHLPKKAEIISNLDPFWK